MTSVNALTTGAGVSYRAAGTTGSNGSNGTTGTGQTDGSTSGTTTTPANDQLGKDTFLKLLVAQLQYQDPSNPADATQFIAQTAQFTVVEKLTDLATQNSTLIAVGQAQSAAALVGRTVTWTDAGNASHTGVVTTANLTTPPTLTIGDQTVDLSAITAVTATKSGTA